MIGSYGTCANVSSVAVNHRSAGVNPAVAFSFSAIWWLAVNHRPAGINPAVALTL